MTAYSPRRRLTPAFFALLVVLAGISGSIGYLGTRQVLVARQANTTPTSGPSSSATASPLASDDPAFACPTLTSQAIADKGLDANLQLLMYIAFHPATGTGASGEVWVCRNGTGLLVYQGHVKSAPMTSANSDNTLLLADGVRGSVAADADGFVAINPSSDSKTEYHVSRTELVIIFPSGSQTKYVVDRVVSAR